MVLSGAGSRPVFATPILLVEDDRADAGLVQACLAEVGVPKNEVIWVRSLPDAVAALSRRPRCVLFDPGVPDSGGYAPVQQLIQEAPHIPVIVLTSHHEEDGAIALASGAQDYIVKDSLSGELLERSIRYAIERKRARRTRDQLHEARLSATEQARLERGLLPSPLLSSQGVACSTFYQPGRDHAVLGGDFFDVVETPDGHTRAVIGDVMGHGPDEAALGVHLRVAWRTLVLAGTPDEHILPTLARLLEAEQDERRPFVTVCDLTIDASGVSVRLAGHPAPIMSADGVCTYPELEVGLPLGVRSPDGPAHRWPENRLSVPSGTSLLLYTDGLLDAYATGPSDSVGIAELVDAANTRMRSDAAPTGWIARLVADAPHEPVDDIAAVLLTVDRR